jgi:hypothetical protein
VNNIFSEEGFLIRRNYYSKDAIKELNTYLDSLTPRVSGLNYEVPWGYGDFKKEPFFLKNIFTNDLKEEFNNLYPEGWNVSHLVVNEKAPFVGQDVEWHQECSNIDTFSPGAQWESSWKKFIQIYVALDDETELNGGLLFFSKSHEDGLLEHVEILSPALTHKRGLTYDSLSKASKKFTLKKAMLKSGDLLIFNSLLIHGSGRNMDSLRRRSIVSQIYSIGAPEWNQDIFQREQNFRKNYVSEKLSEYVDRFSQRVMYEDIKR